MPRLDHMPEDASPVSVTQAGLIRLNGPARAIALDVLRVNSLQTGAYVSHFRGRGMEFDESRPYQPGDDPRSIDWRVTARSTTASPEQSTSGLSSVHPWRGGHIVHWWRWRS